MGRKRAAPKPKRVPGTVEGLAVCARCFESVNLTAFRDDKLAGRLPIVHACGRVLYGEPA